MERSRYPELRRGNRVQKARVPTARNVRVTVKHAGLEVQFKIDDAWLGHRRMTHPRRPSTGSRDTKDIKDVEPPKNTARIRDWNRCNAGVDTFASTRLSEHGLGHLLQSHHFLHAKSGIRSQNLHPDGN